MEAIVLILAVVILMGIFGNLMNKKKEDENNNPQHDNVVNSVSESAHQSTDETPKENEKQMKQGEKPDTIGLMFNTLSALGCQPLRIDDEKIGVIYQGENFFIESSGMYCRIWDLMWTGVSVDDPNLPKVREAVNVTNFGFGPTVMMEDPDEKGVIGFTSRFDIMLHPACPDNVPFVKSVLDSFFKTKENFRTASYLQINAQPVTAQRTRRPVGFTTSETASNDE